MNKFMFQANINLCLLEIYRPHADSPENFTYPIKQLLQNNKLCNQNCIILGGINLNLLLANSAVDELVATIDKRRVRRWS